MNIELLEQMATDLKIKKFKEESIIEFSCRVIYSSMSIWLRIILLDDYSEEFYKGVSKRYHTIKGNEVLDNYYKIFPDVRIWFDIKNENPIKVLQKLLLDSGEIYEDNNGNLKLSISMDEVISTKIVRRLGIGEYNLKLNGVIRVKKTEDIIESKLNLNNAKDLRDNLLKTSNLKKIELEKMDKEYYDPLIKTDTEYASWVELDPNLDTYICRIKYSEYSYKYFLVDNNFKEKKIIEIDEYFIESKEIYRLLLLMRSEYNNRLKVYIKRYKNYFVLEKYIKNLPKKENTILKSIGWPKKDINDQRNIYYNNEMLPLVEKILENLMIDINEVEYER